MPIQKKIYEPDLQTDRAKDVKGERIYIDIAKSGRNGYFCLGCDKPMQANIQRKNPNHRSYFSHIPVDFSKGEKKCTYNNREQRELIATDILQRIKIIKVPEVLKFPPKGTKGNPVELSKSKFITAYKVKSQLTFYEDEEGKIHNGKNPTVEDRYLLLRPDVTFFNEKDEAILFIELVDTHKVTDEKKIKLRRLGIDTISIVVPRASDQEIEDNFKSIQRVKWEYNEKEARTSYLSVSHRAPEGILEFDDQQRRIFGESAKCRKSRINNTIRTFRKCLEGKSYGDTKRDFERELFRIKSATEGVRERLANLEEKYDAEVFSEFEGEYSKLQQREGDLGKEKKELQTKSSDLEGRYQSRREKIRRELERIKSIKATEFENGGTEESIREKFKRGSEALRDEFEEISRDYKRTIRDKKESNRDISDKTGNLSKFFGQLESEEQNSFREQENRIGEKLNRQFRLKEDSLSRDIEKEERDNEDIRENKRSLSEEFGKLEEKERARIRDQEREIAEKDKQLEGTIREDLIRELKKPTSKLPRKLSLLLEAQRVGSDYQDAQRQEEYYQRAREFFNKGTWKK